MKRIVLPFLLSATYLALMTFLFSTDVSRENNFLFEKVEFAGNLQRCTQEQAKPAIQFHQQGETAPLAEPGIQPLILEHSPESAAD